MRRRRKPLRILAATAIVATAVVATGTAWASVPSREGNLLTTCKLDHVGSDDPIKFPGAPGGSAHQHDFFGVKGIDAFTTTASLRNHPNTCDFAADSIAVWIPSMVWADGSEHPATRIDIYYRKPVHSRVAVHAFPMGLRTIVGDAINTTKPSVALWECGSGTFQGAIPPAACTAGVNESMYFPQCWDGRDLDAPDHHTLVGCTGAPGEIRLPQIQVIAHFPPGSGGGKLESDIDASTSAGRTAHDDYWFAGNPRVWRTIIRRCLNAGVQCRVVGGEDAWPRGSIVNVSVTPPKLVMTASEVCPHPKRRHVTRHRPRATAASQTSGERTARR